MAAPGLHINQLPDELLLQILVEALREEADTARGEIGFIRSAPRRDAALVCRRWATLCNAAPALASLTVRIGPTADFMPRARSFFEWLVRRGAGAVEALHLVLQPFQLGPPDQQPLLSTEAALELGTLLAAALLACAGSLTRLELKVHGFGADPFPMGLWVAMLGSQLRRLVLDIDDMWFSTSLESLTGLGQLELRGCAILEPQCRLPHSLTLLRLRAGPFDQALPTQVSALTNLVEFECQHDDVYPSDGYASLAALSSSLRRLNLFGCAAAPSCLPQLTALESLGLTSLLLSTPAVLEPWRAALPHLQRLTYLWCSMLHPFPDAADQAAFAAAPQLVSFHYHVPAEYALPLSGPWLGKLRSLEAPLSAATPSLTALSSTATRLQQLEVRSEGEEDDEAAQFSAVVDWAVHHTSLRKLTLFHVTESVLREQLLEAASRRSTLRIRLGS